MRYSLVAAVAGALAFPLLTQHLRAQDKPAAKAASAKAAPAKAAPAKDASAPAEPSAANAQPAPAAAAPKTDPDMVIATAGDLTITGADFEGFLTSLAPQQQAQLAGDPAGRRQVAEHLVKVKAMAREAERRKLDQDPKLQAQLAAARTQLLVQALVASMQGDEAADKKYFDEHQDQFGKVQARHILVSTRGSTDPKAPKETLSDEAAKKKADDIRARLEKGEDFAAIVKAESDDPGSKETGGEYTFGRGQMVPEFEKTAFSLKEKEISQPVKTAFGYHVIQLLKRVPSAWEDSKADVTRLRTEGLMKELAGGEVKVEEDFVNAGKTAAPPTPATPAAGATSKSEPKTAK